MRNRSSAISDAQAPPTLFTKEEKKVSFSPVDALNDEEDWTE
jgi:hypothetical protein